MPFLRSLAAGFALVAPVALAAQARPAARQAPARPAAARSAPAAVPMMAGVDSQALAGLRWREIGPYRGGRSVAVAGSAQRPHEYYMGTTGGGVYKTTDGGMNWTPITDKYFGGTIGAIEVAASNPDIVYVGGGETCIRGNVSHGEGVWRSNDAGKTWTSLGLKETEQIARVRVHPTNPEIVYVAALGKVHGPSAERGIFRTRDGGKSWQKVKFVNDSTGAIDLQMDPKNPNVLYAAFWQAGRTPWMLSSGGTHSAVFKSTDGGDTWTELSKNKGFPTGIVGRIGLALSPANTQRVWAIVEHDSGGVYRSDDGGASWRYLNDERKLRQRAWYYSHLYADPKDTNVVYALNVGFFKSTDGGKTFRQQIQVPHGDNHDMWIAPDDPQRMVEANDGGANVSYNGGRTWTDQDFATAQFYHVTTTTHFPYNICGAQQDNSTVCGPSREPGGIEIADWYDAGGCESGYIASNPKDPDVTFAGCYGGTLTRMDRTTGFERNVTVHPINPMGQSSEDIKIRFQWTFPIHFSLHDPRVLYAAGSRLFRSTDEGGSWQQVSPELARRDPKTMGPSGGPITRDQTGVETYAVIFAFAESPVTPNVLWTGTDDGYVWLSRDGGKNWKNVTPTDMQPFTRVSIVEASRWNAGTAYVAANRYQLDDKRPYLWKTTDFGATWTRIDASLHQQAPTEFTRVIREDETRKGLLFVGTERGAWFSLDDGAHWQTLQKNLPPVPIHDLVVKEGDVVVATHGRSFWVMDDITPLRQLSPQTLAKAAHLYQPRDQWRLQLGGGGGGGDEGRQHPVGANPPSGAIIHYHLAQPNQDVMLEFLDANGRVIRSYTSRPDSASMADSLGWAQRRTARRDSLLRAGVPEDSVGRLLQRDSTPPRPDPETLQRTGPRPPRVPNRAGHNTFVWNLRYPDASRFDGMILWAAGTQGPTAPPGTYAVRLTTGGQSQTARFALRKDPRVTSTQAELEEQFRFLTRIRDRFSEANDAVKTIRTVKSDLAAKGKQVKGADSAAYAGIARDVSGKLFAVEDEIYQTRNQSSQDPLNYPIKLNNKIGALMGVVGQGDYKPTKQSYEAYEELSALLEVQLQAMRKILSEELPKANELLRKNGVQPVVVPGPRA